MRGYIPPATDEERLFCRRVEDVLLCVRQRGVLRVLPFCSDREQDLAAAVLSKMRCDSYLFYGGYESAERKMLAFAQETPDKACFPITALLMMSAQGSPELTHRDYLGALMALRIGREYLGDLVPAKEGMVLLAHERAAALVLEELREVGRARVRVCTADEALLAALSAAPEPSQLTATISSLRLDAMLAAMLKISRADAAALIRAKTVAVNHIETTNIHCEVCEGDGFTVRGRGKYKLCTIGGQSKKDRTFVSYIQY
ncbi:MAG: YlmH/Sll1252 family protein [Ruthenibacterium sp.]